MRTAIDLGLFLLLLACGSYFVYTHPRYVPTLIQKIESGGAPCGTPVTYSLGAIDSRFGISKDVVRADVQEAETIWEKPSGKNLFQYAESGGDVTVNFVYDNRQAATDKLKTAGVALGDSKATYEALKTEYTTLESRIKTEQATYESRVATYKQDEENYNANVTTANRHGGASPAEYSTLTEQRTALANELAAIQTLERALNADIEILNALATTLNKLIVELNLNVEKYNRTGSSLGEFEEGLYKSSGGVETIDIYEYQTHAELVRVLAHELGHARGFDHVADQKAIMYKINASGTLVATPADLAELNRVCKFQ